MKQLLLPQQAQSLSERESKLKIAIERYEDQYRSSDSPVVRKDVWYVLVDLRQKVKQLNPQAA